MKISIITVVYNCENFIKDCIESVLNQNYENIEYIIIDGESTDNTLKIVGKYKERISIVVSSPDNGMYDALNKGIALATGEVIGILNADDILAHNDIIDEIVSCFKESQADAIYGDLDYVHPTTMNIIRHWRTSQHSRNDFKYGWMPAHPTLYIKASIYLKYGNYSLGFGTAADYELMLRFLYKYQIKAVFMPKLIVKMRNGGQSNASLKSRFDAFKNDYKAAEKNSLPLPFSAIILKKLRKIQQYL